MSCFTIENWVDFVRQSMPRERLADMQRHLDQGCKRCADVLHVWRSLLGLAAKEASYEPPDGVVRIVKASFGQLASRKAPRGLAMVASLIFDSSRQPRPVGVRTSRQPLPQQLLYAAGDYLVDLRVEGGPTRVSLVGQILNSSRPKDAIRSIPVALVRGSEPIAKAVTSAFGEFEFEFEFQAGKDLQLAIGLNPESSITISLRDLKPPARRAGGSWQRSLRPYIFSGRNPFREQ